MGSIGRSMYVFLQVVPPELLPLLEQRLQKARGLQSVVSIAEERFWALDEASTVGSMHVINTECDLTIAPPVQGCLG
jgi:hypothetical protein